MSDCHGHSHHADASNPRLGLAIALTFAFVIGEAAAGYFAHSLALMSDAGHNLTDVLALAFSWYAVVAAKRPACAERTFGSHRVGILAALANALTLVAIGAIIIWEGIARLINPTPVESGPMIWVALVAVILNGVISYWLHRGAKHDLNIRSAYLHMLGDAASACGVVIAGIYVAFTGSVLADPIVSLFIAAFIIWSSWGIIVESVNVLLEAAPKSVNMADLERSIKNVDGVLDVHDLHVWTVASGLISLSCHVLVSDQSVRSGEQVLKTISHMVEHDFHISHSTIQLEVEGCEESAIFCTMRKAHGNGHDHGQAAHVEQPAQ
jgi:cobalt-zinc-cadmium efflux system protein